MDDAGPAPLVLVHCGWPGDRELASRVLGAMGIACHPLGEMAELQRLLADDRLDLVLADASGGHGPLGVLLDVLEAHPEARDLPLILLADELDAPLVSDVVARRFHATLLTKPVERAQFEAAVRAGLRYWAGRRENRRLMAELEASHGRFYDLVHNTDAIVWEADAETGRLTFVSRRAEDWFGGPAARWPSLPDAWLERVIPDDREYAAAARRSAVNERRDFELEYRALTTQGRTLWLREAGRVARDAEGRAAGLRGLVWDITRRKKIERQLYKAKAALAEQLDDLAHLHGISVELAGASGLEATLEEVLASVTGVVGAEMGLLRLRDRERGDLEIAANVGLPPEYLARYRHVPEVSSNPALSVDEHGCVFIPDVDVHPDGDGAPFREAARLGGYRAAFAIPLTSREGARLGVVVTFFREPHRPGERQVRLVALYAQQATGCVEAARLHAELRDAERRKDEFLARFACELHRPVTSISGPARAASGAAERESLA